MTSYKRSVHISQHEEPWLRYPDPLKASHGHSRAFSPTPPSHAKPNYHPDIHATKSITETSPVPGLNHKRSSSKLKQTHTSPSTHPQRHHNHGHGHGPHHHQSKSSKPRSLSDELNLALHNDDHSDTNSTASSNNNSTTNLYPSPVTPSDFLSIPNYATSNSSTSSSSSASNHFPVRNRPESPVHRSNSISKRPSPLSINTNLAGFAQQHMPKQRPDSIHMASPTSTASRGSSSPRATGGLGTPLPRLTHGTSFPSSASNSSCSNASSPSSSTAPCSVLCQKNHSHSHAHSHPHHHNHNHSPHHHHPSCNHKHARPHRHHHPGCQHHRGDRRERSETPLPMSLEEEMAAAGAAANQDVEEGGLILPPPEPITETSMVVATFGVAAEKQEAPKHAKEPSSESTGLYEEPPKKKMRSTAAILLGAAVETVILTSAVALSAYHLLTGKGKDQPKEETTEVVEEPKPQEPEKPVLQIQSAPVNIPRGLRHKSSGSPRPHHMAHSYHHTSHHYKKSKNKSNVAVLSSSLPHAQTHRFGDREALPGRPDTGTEDNDEQFLRMEAQLTTLIAEGKRALSSRIESWDEMSEASARR